MKSLVTKDAEISAPLLEWIRSHRLEPVVVFLLESSKPIRGLLQQVTIGFEPIVRALIGVGGTQALLELLESPERVEDLIRELER